MYGAAEGADALALVTEWHEYRSPDFERLKRMMREPVLFDGRNMWAAERGARARLHLLRHRPPLDAQPSRAASASEMIATSVGTSTGLSRQRAPLASRNARAEGV